MAHPQIENADQLHTPAGTAAELGYRMPAEWEPHAAVWLTPPHNVETWPVVMEKAIAQYDAWVDAMRKAVPVSTTQELNIPTNDSWIRDYGPIFVVHRDLGLACHDFQFNGWGNKYEHRDYDDVVPQHIARQLHLPIWIHDLVLEGGSIEVNGRGTVLTTEQCLLNENRNPHLTREQIETKLHETLGTTHVIWLPGGIEGDDTDGHIDDIARFINPDTVAALRAPQHHPDHDTLEQNWQVLQQARDQGNRKLNLIELPVPETITFDYPADRFGPGGPAPLPASYANFLITNGSVFVPTFGQPNDELALRTLDDAMPEHIITPVRSEWLVVGLGALHCLSQQQPAG
ncbi:agmatine deiminase family protein [Phycisphaerales bacterium AB-hyl4]|uniref:Agmatine deiminase family protein n=1 Tax=Natronomicrosphaera hydrolytica TaxID=3242702 RepID=A0ABV4U6P7_9BACT